MKYIKYYSIIAGFLLSFSAFGDQEEPKATIRVAIFYSAEAEDYYDSNDASAAGLNLKDHIEKSCQNINEILLDNNSYEVKFVSITQFQNYREPKHRKEPIHESGNRLDDPYIHHSFNGTYQVLDEIVNHKQLVEYFFHDGPELSYLRKNNDLETGLIDMHIEKNLPDVVLIIVEEEGPVLISDERLLHFSGTELDDPLYAVIDVKEISQNNLAIPLAFFDMFTLRDNSDESLPTLMSFWNDDINNNINLEGNTLLLLSDKNEKQFNCSANNLKLGSPDKMDVENAEILDSETDTNFDAQTSISIKESRIRRIEDGSSVRFTVKRYKVPSEWIPPPCAISVNARLANSQDELVMDSLNVFDPLEKQLSVIYPNPFESFTTIQYIVSEPAMPVTIVVHDYMGALVDVLLQEEEHPGGIYSITWNAENLPDGIYICNFYIGDRIESRKLILQK